MGVIVYGASVIGIGLQLFFVAALAYSFALVFLFFSPVWKAAYTPYAPLAEPVRAAAPEPEPQSADETQDSRDAA
jgi:hypothetical protein